VDELARAQGRLARAIGKARAGEDRELAQRVRENGESLAQMLSGLLRLTRVHAADNQAFDAPVEDFGRALRALHQLLGPVHLVAVEDQVYANEVRLRSEGRPGLAELGAELRRHNVGGLTFQGPLDARQVRALVAAFAARPEERNPRSAVRARLEREGIGAVELDGIFRFRTGDEPAAGAADPNQTLRAAMRLAAEAFGQVAAGRGCNPLAMRRAVSSVVEAGPLGPALWSGWVASAPRHEHALAVALHALALGEAAGLSRAVLQDLGVAALLHDVGYAALAVGPGSSGPDGLARHPGEGARVLLRQRGYSESKLRRLRAVLDHHRDLAGPRGPPSALGAILRIAEDYACFLRVHGARVTAGEVLGAMARAAGSLYHPVLLQLFVNTLGAFPPGTLLELADGRRARSASLVRGPDRFAAPLALLCDPATGAPCGPTLDLADGPLVRRALPG
jgi:hypothetical protein